MPEATPPRTINVSGTGRVSVNPDVADLRLGVTLTAETVEAARAFNATAMAGVIGALKGLRIAPRDIQTTNLTLSPAYDYSSNTNPPRLTGYTLANTVAVTIRDLAKVGAAIDGAMRAGATTLDSIAFRVEDSAAAERQAREAAVADARAKANVLAAAAGVTIRGTAAISESGAPIAYPMVRGEMAKMAFADAATPVEAGTNEISITVAISYLID
jgi:uncharacterized protein YggE